MVNLHMEGPEGTEARQASIARYRVGDTAAYHRLLDDLLLERGMTNLAVDLKPEHPETVHDVIFFALDGDEPVGMVAMQAHRSNVVEARWCHLLRDARGRGHERTMVMSVVDWAKDIGYKAINVNGTRETPFAEALGEAGFVFTEDEGSDLSGWTLVLKRTPPARDSKQS